MYQSSCILSLDQRSEYHSRRSLAGYTGTDGLEATNFETTKDGLEQCLFTCVLVSFQRLSARFLPKSDSYIVDVSPLSYGSTISSN